MWGEIWGMWGECLAMGSSKFPWEVRFKGISRNSSSGEGPRHKREREKRQVSQIVWAFLSTEIKSSADQESEKENIKQLSGGWEPEHSYWQYHSTGKIKIGLQGLSKKRESLGKHPNLSVGIPKRLLSNSKSEIKIRPRLEASLDLYQSLIKLR